MVWRRQQGAGNFLVESTNDRSGPRADRRNARKSTGPRTDSGKALARTNAVRHGVLTAASVLPGEDIAAWD